VSISVASVMTPAGPEKGVGVLTATYGKDPTDPTWKDDAGMKQWRDFMTKNLPEADQTDANYVYGYGVSLTMLQVLKQCNGDFSRESIMKQAASLKDFELPTLLPGIKINTSASNFHPITQMQLQKWDGKTWVLFGDVISGNGT
jgi:branched-chain amino acid transport system substrate-binding protein